MAKNDPVMEASISAEHSDLQESVKECFSDINIDFGQKKVFRLSGGELPIAIVFFIGGLLIDGMLYDAFKVGLKKLFEKFKNPQVTIECEQKDGVPLERYSIDEEMKLTKSTIRNGSIVIETTTLEAYRSYCVEKYNRPDDSDDETP